MAALDADWEQQEKLLREEDRDTSEFGSSSRESQEGGYTFEEALEITGYGLYHFLLLCICGWANASDAVEVLCVSFLLPSAECDMKLTSVEKGWLNATIFIGMMVGGYIWGSLADIQGRKKLLMITLTVNGVSGLASSFCQSFIPFLFMRFFSGLGVGGSIPVVFSYASEFQPRDKRGSFLTGVSSFWMIGNILTAGLAWLIIPQQIDLKAEGGKFQYQSWRVFVAVCCVPSLSAALILFFFPESPKFLYETGKEEEAISVLSSMFITNNRKCKRIDYPVKKIIPSNSTNLLDGDMRKRLHIPSYTSSLVAYKIRLKYSFITMMHSTVKLFKKPHTAASISLLVITFTLSFGYYGLWMWFPQIFALVEQNHGSACSNLNLNPNVSDSPCDVAQDPQIYIDGFITAASNLPGNLITFLLVDRIGRKFLLSVSLLVSGVSVFFIWILSTRVQVLAMSCVFGGVSVIAWNVLNVLGTEVYPTHLRSTGMGVMSTCNRMGAILGNVTFGVLINSYCAVPIIIVAVLLIFGSFFTYRLPKTNNIILQ